MQDFVHQPYNPDPREDLESRSPNLGPYTTKGKLIVTPLKDLLFGSVSLPFFGGLYHLGTSTQEVPLS